jgi:tetracycline resistance efflux pump
LFLATRVGQALNPVLYPVIMFILSCIIAFATGTSWGTFAIMIPIAVDFAVLLAPNLLIGMIGAVLAGAVYGDHCSPISDTTILSSTGAGCNHIDHVSTQLPYATVSAVMCGIGYIVYGFMAQSGVSTAVTIAVSFLVTLGLLAIVLKGLNALTSGSEFKIGSRRRVA